MEQRLVGFSYPLLRWYKENKRNLPWREHSNPYYIWVSEIMLQQTRVDTVIPYFERFIKRFPTIESLAYADEEEVLKLWEGLGYYSRARNLQSAVREVHEQYGGEVPRTRSEIMNLKGVGPYTAGAILSIAFNLPEPAVDGNVMRVLSRYFLIEEDITKGSTRAHMERLLYGLIPVEEAGDFTQALMELGAMICTPRSPGCLICPVMKTCAARLEGVEAELPVKKRAKPPRIEQRVAAYITLPEDGERAEFLLQRRPERGLLAKMWELPHYSLAELNLPDHASDELARETLAEKLMMSFGFRLKQGKLLMTTDHTFSHIHWEMRVFSYEVEQLDEEFAENEALKWVAREQLVDYALPNVFVRILGEQGKK